jgi:hypothetical protein
VQWAQMVDLYVTGFGRAHHGEIFREAAGLMDAGQMRPLVNERRFTLADIAAAHELVETGVLGKLLWSCRWSVALCLHPMRAEAIFRKPYAQLAACLCTDHYRT